MLKLENDGIDHINIYSRGTTELGRMLSNFYKFQIKTKDGIFESVESYWYWMSIADCEEKELLRTMFGFQAKKFGKQLVEKYGRRHDDNFESNISNAIWYKFKRNSNLILPRYKSLPFEHYYVFSGKVTDVKSKYTWMIDNIEQMRKMILGV